MIISINAERAFGKIEYTYMIKTISKVGIVKNFLKLAKAIKTPTANIILYIERLICNCLLLHKGGGYLEIRKNDDYIEQPRESIKQQLKLIHSIQ